MERVGLLFSISNDSYSRSECRLGSPTIPQVFHEGIVRKHSWSLSVLGQFGASNGTPVDACVLFKRVHTVTLYALKTRRRVHTTHECEYINTFVNKDTNRYLTWNIKHSCIHHKRPMIFDWQMRLCVSRLKIWALMRWSALWKWTWIMDDLSHASQIVLFCFIWAWDVLVSDSTKVDWASEWVNSREALLAFSSEEKKHTSRHLDNVLVRRDGWQRSIFRTKRV